LKSTERSGQWKQSTMISYQTLALWINIAIVAAVAAGAFRRRGTAGAVALIILCAMVATWTKPLIPESRRGFWSFSTGVRAHGSVCPSAAFSSSERDQPAACSIGTSLFAAVPLLILVVFGVLGPAGALHATVMIYVFVMALGGALLLLDAFLQRRRSVLSALGLAFLGSLLPVAALILEATGRSPFAGLSLPPLAFGLCAMGFLNGLFDRRPEEIGAIDRHAAVEGMDEGWIVLDVNDTVVDMNPAAERMTGSPRDLGQPISSCWEIFNLGLTPTPARKWR
jgi:PAS domain-containing protein